MKSMKSLLAELDIIDTEQLEIFSTRTRDQADLCVLRDTESGVIFIDGFLTEQSSYASGSYREELKKIYGARHHEINIDVSRRIKDYKQFYVGKNILDFGCGEGSFLRGIMDLASSVSGLEIQTVYIDELKNDGINCLKPDGAFYVFPSCKGLMGKKDATGKEDRESKKTGYSSIKLSIISFIFSICFLIYFLQERFSMFISL